MSYVEYTCDSKLKKFREMLLTTLTHNENDVIAVNLRLPVSTFKGSAGRICHLENVKSYMSYLQQCTEIIKMLTFKTYFI
jgi:hypothetical protein